MKKHPPSIPQQGQGRLVYLDNLKVFLTALVISHHSAIAFGASGGWYYVIPPPPDSLAPIPMTMFAGINQAFFMGLFFFISAYFTPLSCDKKGPAVYLKDRLLRLGVPLLAFFFVLNPSVLYLVFRFTGRIPAGYFAFMADDLLDKTSVGPLWFVLSLLFFAGVYLLLRLLVSPRITPSANLPLPGNRTIFLFVIGAGLFTFLVRILFPVGWAICNLQLGYFPLYIAMYTFGVLACRHAWLDTLQPRQANLWLAASVALIALMPPLMALGGALEGHDDVFNGGLHWQALAYALWEPTLCIGISMKLLLLFRRRANIENALTRALARSAYTAYILHPFFVISGTYLLLHLPAGPFLRFLALCPLAIASCFAVSDLVRRAPALRRIL